MSLGYRFLIHNLISFLDIESRISNIESRISSLVFWISNLDWAFWAFVGGTKSSYASCNKCIGLFFKRCKMINISVRIELIHYNLLLTKGYLSLELHLQLLSSYDRVYKWIWINYYKPLVLVCVFQIWGWGQI